MTNQEKLIAEVRELLAQAEVETALSKLSAYYLTASHEKEGADALVQIRAQYERLRFQEIKNTISAENAQIQRNQINDRLLHLLDQVGDQPQALPTEGPIGRSKNALIALGIIGGLVLAVILFIVLRKKDPPPPVVDPPMENPTMTDCPEFDLESRFNIMILPFQPLDGNLINTHLGIQNRLAFTSEQFQLPTSVRIYENIDPTATNNYPLNGRDAAGIARPCNARLVIWGSTESDKDANIVYTRFKFIDLDDHFALTKLRITETSSIDTITRISAIARDGLLTADIENSIKLLFGIIAHETQQDAVAIDMLEELQVDPADTATTVLRNMILADSYIKSGQEEKALEAYDSVLQRQPDNLWALNNGAALNFKKNNFNLATDYLSAAIQAFPGNPELRTQRATIYLKTDRLDKARKDLEQISPRQGTGEKSSKVLFKELEEKEAVQQRRIDKSDRKLRRNPTDVNAMKEKTEALYNLGNYTAAQKMASKLIGTQPNDKVGYLILSETELERGDTAEAIRIIETAIQRNLINARDVRILQPTLPRVQAIRRNN